MSRFSPRRRSYLRLAVGSRYFRLKRYIQECFSRVPRAQNIDRTHALCFYQVFKHETPLFRQLNRSQQWLQNNKIINLGLALQSLNDVIIRPGEVLSFWHLVGKPSCRKGYRKGMVLCEGKIQAGTGGGLCQLSNLIYWMTLHTPLTVVERWRHNYDVFPDVDRTQPFGSGATVTFNYVDLQIKNDTPNCYQLRLALMDTHLCGAWWSDATPVYTYEVYEKDHWITQEPQGAYVRHNRICRHIINADGEVIADQQVAENHAIMMYPPLLHPGNPDCSF